MILKARAVRKSKLLRCCDWCEKPIRGPHLYLVGIAEYDFVVVRYHAHCWRGSRGSVDDKERAAFEKLDVMLKGVRNGKTDSD